MGVDGVGRRRVWGVAAAFVVVLAVVHGVMWFTVTGRMLDGVPAFQARAAAVGWVVQGGTPRRAGWPFEARVVVPGVSATRPLGGTRVVWTSEAVALVIRPGAAGTLSIEPEGAGSLRLGEAAAVPVRAAAAAWQVPLDGVGPGVLAVRELVAGSEAAGLRVARVDARVEAGMASGVVAGEAAGVEVLPPFPAPFAVPGELSGRVVVTPPFPVAATPAGSATAWRDAGGRVAVPELRFAWGPLLVAGTAEAGLDPMLQPFGSARLRVGGALEVLEAGSRAGVIQPGPAAAARAVLSLLILAAQGGPVSLPVTLRDRTLVAAQFALLRVPVLSWDQ